MEVQHLDYKHNIINISIYNRFRLRGPRKSYRCKRISKVHKLMIDIQTAHAKLGSQDGNSR